MKYEVPKLSNLTTKELNRNSRGVFIHPHQLLYKHVAAWNYGDGKCNLFRWCRCCGNSFELLLKEHVSGTYTVINTRYTLTYILKDEQNLNFMTGPRLLLILKTGPNMPKAGQKQRNLNGGQYDQALNVIVLAEKKLL